jgi:ribosomal protein S18 acetylase RimI-like enzyme
MAEAKENSLISCKFLNENYFAELQQTFVEAFSDYTVPFEHKPEQFRWHLSGNAVDIELSVGCFYEDKMTGFTLNGFGEWNGRATAYDAGTGVIPAFRRRGMGRAMFEFMLPVLRERGIEQMLLEVLTTNEKAVNLYRGLEFEETRNLLILKAEQPLKFNYPPQASAEIREISRPDWNLLRTFWDAPPSWQNSPEAVERTREVKKILGAFIDNKCAGYVIFSGDSGKLTQLAVAKENRNRGVGSLLLTRMQSHTNEKNPLQVINLDESLADASQFLQNRGFGKTLSQYEMIKFF